MIKALIACFLLVAATPVFAHKSKVDYVNKTITIYKWNKVVDISKGVKNFNLAGRQMSCDGASILVDNTIPVPAAGTISSTKDPAKGFIILNLKTMRDYEPATQWFTFSHECGHLYGSEFSEAVADEFGVWKGVDEGWLEEEDLSDICFALDPDAPAGNGYPSGRQRCKNIKAAFAKYDAKKKKKEAVPK
jgi:hypothetical protein